MSEEKRTPPGDATPARLDELERLSRQPSPECTCDDPPWPHRMMHKTDCPRLAHELAYMCQLRDAAPALLAAARERETLRRKLNEAYEHDYLVCEEVNALRPQLDALRQQLATLTAERDGLREALQGFVDAFKLDWEGHALGTLIAKARAVLESAPLPRERGADTPGGADLLSGEPKREWPTVMVYPQDDDGHDWRYVISGNGWSAESSGFWETAREAMRAGADAILDRLAPRLPDPSGGRE